MGGGDLNLKKSWHPSTLRNIERVWKAEQKHEVEQQKIEQLQKELAEERAREEIQTFAEDQGVVKKKDEKLDWMYQGPAAMVNREEYLLGRKVDKTFETLTQLENGKAPSNENSDVTITLFNSQDLSGTATVDLANKIKEDPLFNIMKKEKEERKNLLSNPVKMKQLQQLLKASIGKEKNKKSKKNKKKKHRESDSEEEVQERKKKHKKRHSSESDEEMETARKTKKKYLPRERDMSPEDVYISRRQSSKYEYASSDFNSRKSSKYSFNETEHGNSYSSNFKESKYSSREPSHQSSRDMNHHSSRESNQHSSSHKEYASQSYRNSTTSRSSYKPSNYENDKREPDKKKKMDSKERERLLKEMQDNAKWREEQRKVNTQRYKDEDEREDRVKKIDPSDFLKPMLTKFAGKGSLENRVKQKIFSIQRSSSAMDKNFARRE